MPICGLIPTTNHKGQRAKLSAKLQGTVDKLNAQLRDFDPAFDASRKMRVYTENAKVTRTHLSENEGLPQWDQSGNQMSGDTDFPLDIQSGHYNSLYAVLGDPDWPVPNPITSESMLHMPYTSVVGDFSQNYTFVNDGADTLYVQVCVDPTCTFPVSVYSGSAADGYVVNTQALTLVASASTNDVPFVQVDPRLMVWGTFLDSTNYVAGATIAKSYKFQQIMGGHVGVRFSCPWESTAEVSIADPMIAPTLVGNKMTKFPVYTGSTSYPWGIAGRSLQNVGATTLYDGSVLNPTLTATMPSVNQVATRRFMLVGAGSSSSLDTCARIIPCFDGWVPAPITGLAGSSQAFYDHPTVYSGRQFYSIKLQPSMSISLDVSGWVSYNVTVDVNGGAGLALLQHCPISRSHASNVANVPITVGVDFKGRSENDLTRTYIGSSVPLSRQSNNTPAIPVAQISGSTFGNMARNIMQKFTPIVRELSARYLPSAKRIVNATGNRLLSRVLKGVASKLPMIAAAAPLLLG